MTPVSAREVAGFDLEALAARLRDVADVRGLDARAERTAEALTVQDREAVLELADAVKRLSRELRGLDR